MHDINKKRLEMISVGYYSNSMYENGTQVAQVAIWNDHGTIHIPERPFFRHATEMIKPAVARIVKAHNDSTKPQTIETPVLRLIGEMCVGKIQESITGVGISYEPNLPATIKNKGSDKPLINKSTMLQSTDYKIGALS